MSARDDVLANIRRSLGVTGKEATRRGIVAAGLQDGARGPIPARGQGSPAARMATFIAEAQRVSASVVVLDNAAAVPAEVARYLRDSNLPLEVRIGVSARLADLDWRGGGMTTIPGASAGADLSAGDSRFRGRSRDRFARRSVRAGNPTTLNFLPDNHIVVLSTPDVVGDYETLWPRRRGKISARADAATFREPDHRSVAFRRHRADAHPRRARPAPIAYSRDPRLSCNARRSAAFMKRPTPGALHERRVQQAA